MALFTNQHQTTLLIFDSYLKPLIIRLLRIKFMLISLSSQLEAILPKQSKVSPAERLGWLERNENGARPDQLATEAKRDFRTITAHIEKARLERDFEAARREQLREALAVHQRDMLLFLEQLRRAIQVLPLTFLDERGLDFGLEDLWDSSDLVLNQEIALTTREDKSAAIKVRRDQSGPLEVTLTVESSRLCRAVKEHISSDSLWRHLVDWKSALLLELQGRADLNRSVRSRVEEIFGIQVGATSLPGKPRLTSAAIWWVRTRLTKMELGEYVPELKDDIRQASTAGLESNSGQWLADHLVNTEKGVAQFGETITVLMGSEAAKAAAESIVNH